MSPIQGSLCLPGLKVVGLGAISASSSGIYLPSGLQPRAQRFSLQKGPAIVHASIVHASSPSNAHRGANKQILKPKPLLLPTQHLSQPCKTQKNLRPALLEPSQAALRAPSAQPAPPLGPWFL